MSKKNDDKQEASVKSEVKPQPEVKPEVKEETNEVPDQILPVFIPDWDNDEVEMIAEVLDGRLLVEGEKVNSFQRQFAKYVNAKYCVLFPSYTTAMYCALVIARRVFSTSTVRVPVVGSEVIYNTMQQAYYNPVLCEVNGLGSLELRDNDAGVVYHCNGRLGKPSLIEDCRDRPNHHTADKLSVYDFSYDSHITLCGAGGAVCCDDYTIYEQLLRMKMMGKNPMDEEEFFNDDHKSWGLDYTVTEIQAAFGLAQLKHLNEKLERLNVMDNKIREQLIDNKHITLLQGRPWKYLDILVPDAMEVQAELLKKGIMTDRFPKPLHIQTYYGRSGRVDNNFPNAEKLYRSLLYLPSMTGLADEDLLKIIDDVKGIVS